MISILIPVYNEDIRILAKQLSDISLTSPETVEIIFLDDGSTDNFKSVNKECATLQHVNYLEEEKNVGRASIRNKLATSAKGDWLWFLDCDSKIQNNNEILVNYLQLANKNTILSGGRVYQENEPADIKKRLHWKWGFNRELLDPTERMKNPVGHFLSNNFFVHKSIFEKIKFDNQIIGYGYEDTLFAAEAVKQNISIVHINNPVLHDGLEPVDRFLKKIEESLDNLSRLKMICEEKKIKFPVKSKLILAYKILKLPIIFHLFGKWFLRNEALWKMQLKGPSPSLFIFDAWRLAYLLNS